MDSNSFGQSLTLVLRQPPALWCDQRSTESSSNMAKSSRLQNLVALACCDWNG